MFEDGIHIESTGSILVNNAGVLSMIGAGSPTATYPVASSGSCGINIAGGKISGGVSADLAFTGTGGGNGTAGIIPPAQTRNIGINTTANTIISVGAEGSIVFTGHGGLTTNGQRNYGICVNGSTSIIAGTSDHSTATITFSGTGGTGDISDVNPNLSGQNNGMVMDDVGNASTITLNGTGFVKFSNCKAYLATDQMGIGVRLSGKIDAFNGDVIFENCQGGNAANGDHAIHLFAFTTTPSIDLSHIYAKTITAVTNIIGGKGLSTSIWGNSQGVYIDGIILGDSTHTDSINIVATTQGIGPNEGCIYIDNLHSGIIAVKDTGSISIQGTGGPGGNSSNGIIIDGVMTEVSGGTINLIGQGGGVGAASACHGIQMSAGTITSSSNSPLTIRFQGTGGSGSGGGHIGTVIDGGNIILTGTGVATISGTGGNSGGPGDNNMGVQIGSTTTFPLPPPYHGPLIGNLRTQTGSFVFSNCIGGPNGNGNFGLHITTSAIIDAPTITATNFILSQGVLQRETGILFDFDMTHGTGQLPKVHVPSGGTLTMVGTGSPGGADQSYGIGLHSSLNGASYGANEGTIYGDASSTISLTGTAGNGPGTSNLHGFQMQGGTILVGDAGMISITGNGGHTGGGSNRGIYANGGTITAGTGVNPSKIIFSGTSGTNSGDGVRLETPLSLTLTGPGDIIISGSVFPGSSGVGAILSGNTVTAASGQVAFYNCFGGNGSFNNYGVQLTAGSAIDAREILATNVIAGHGGGNNIGFFINGSTVGTASNTNSIIINASGNGIAGQNDGIRIDSSGSLVQGSISGQIILNGIGGLGTGLCRGVYVNGGAISGEGTISITGQGGGASGNGNIGFLMDAAGTITSSSYLSSAISITGSGGAHTFGIPPYGIDVGLNTTISATGGGSISLIGTGGPPNNIIALDATSITSTSGNISFQGPVTLLANPSSIMTGGSGGISFTSTIDGAFDLTLNAGGFITVVGNTGGTTPLTKVDFHSTGRSISVANIDTSGVVGGSINLRPGSGASFSPTLGNVPQGTLTFTGTSVRALGSPNGMISLSPDALSMPMSIATIISLNDLLIQGGTIMMGQNQSMTALGNLTINATGSLTVCDMVSPNQITLVGSTTSLLPQAPAQYLHHVGGLYISPSAHIIGGVAPSVVPVLGSIDQRVDTDSTLTSIRLHYLDSSTVLNYDLNEASSLLEFLFLEQVAIYQLSVANTQLGSLLPMLHAKPCHCPIVRLPHRSSIMLWSNQNRSSNFQPFIFESDILTRTGP